MTNKRLGTNIMPRSLGELELSILQVLWQSNGLSAKSILERLMPQRQVSLSALQSSLENLRKKELVEYRKQRQAFVYSATVTRSELLGQFVGDIIQTLHDGKLDTILSSFVYVASNINDKALDELEKMIQDKRREAETNNKRTNKKEPT